MGARDIATLRLEDFQAAFPETAVMAGGGEWHYRETRDTGEPLILLPGAQGTGDVFYKTALLLGTEFRVVTATPPAWADCERIAGSLGAFLDQLGAERVDLLGASLSGYTAQHFAHLHPERIRTLFLANTFHDADMYLASMPGAEAIAATPAASLMQTLRERMFGAPATQAAEEELKATMRALIGSRQSADTLKTRILALRIARPVARVPLPDARIVLIDADDDPVILPAMRTAMRERYAGCALHAIIGGGHYPAILRPVEFADALRSHLTG
ncbi:MAG: alpha/beta hydrolase [Burkholderiales bacterium]|nr:alpha/beta hydrolase [Burkholderiales bacterium]